MRGAQPRRRSGPTGRRRLVLAAFCVVVAAGSVPVRPLRADFDKAYYPAARSVWTTGTFGYSYEGFKNLPLVAALLAPLGAFPRETAQGLFLGFELACYVASFVLGLKLFSRGARDDWLLLLLFVSSRAWYTCLRLGQLTPLCLALVLLLMAALLRGQRRAAGAFLGLAFLVKIPAGLLGVALLCRGQIRTVAWAAATVAATGTASLALFGSALHRSYLDSAILSNVGRTLTAHNNLSLAGTWARLAGRGGLFDWSPVDVPRPVSVAIFAGVGLLIFRWWRLARREAGSSVFHPIVELSRALCLSLPVLPVAWDHYALLLLPALAVAFLGIRESGWEPRLLAAWLAALVLLELPVLSILLAGGPALARSSLGALLPAAPGVGCLVLFAVLTSRRFAAPRVDLPADAAQGSASAPRS